MKLEASLLLILNLNFIITRKLRVEWRSEDVEKEDPGPKPSHTSVPTRSAPRPHPGCFSQGRRERAEGPSGFSERSIGVLGPPHTSSSFPTRP